MNVTHLILENKSFCFRICIEMVLLKALIKFVDALSKKLKKFALLGWLPCHSSREGYAQRLGKQKDPKYKSSKITFQINFLILQSIAREGIKLNFKHQFLNIFTKIAPFRPYCNLSIQHFEVLISKGLIAQAK